jgi:tetratricopeptide (TPR) repeat protein
MNDWGNELISSSRRRADARQDCERLTGDVAIAACSQLFREDPKDPLPYYNCAFVYEQNGDLDRALSDYTRAIGLDPN